MKHSLRYVLCASCILIFTANLITASQWSADTLAKSCRNSVEAKIENQILHKSENSTFGSSKIVQFCERSADTTKSPWPSKASYSNWISVVLSKKLSNFRPKSRTNPLCNEHSYLYEENLRNLTLWAVQMKEASAATTEGMLVGQSFQTGHYDECVSIQTDSVAGRYCLARLKFAPTPQTYRSFYDHQLESRIAPPHSNAWDTIKKSKDPIRLDRDSIHFGLCVPAACSWKDVEESLSDVFADVEKDHGIILNVSLTERLCSSRVDEKQHMPFLGKLIIYGIVLLTVLCICVTCYHIVLINSGSRCEDSQKLSLINILSIVNNMRKLNEDKGEEDLDVLNGIKVLSMMFMVTAHRVGMTFGGMLYNPTFAEEGIEGRNILLIKSTVVDTYFAISGFLVFTFGYNQFKAQGIKMIPLAFIYRWLRLMPAYMAMLAFIIHALPYLEEGPVWQSVAVKGSENCRRHWWTNFLGINNIVAADEMCLVHSWYVSCDLQLIIIGSVLVYVFSKNHLSGLILAVMALMASIIVPFRNVYVNRYEGIIKLYQSFLVDPVKDTAFREFYIQSWNRAGPFFVGIIAGYILMQIKNEKLRLSMPKRWFALCIAVIVGFGAQVPGWAFYDNDRPYNSLEHALYASLHRTLWAVLICAVIVIQLAWGIGKAVEQILTHKFYTPLSRLIYQVYLIHGVWELFHLASLRHPLYVSVPHFATLVAGDFFLSNLLGLWLYLIIDRPAGNLRSYLIERVSRPRESKKNGLKVSKK